MGISAAIGAVGSLGGAFLQGSAAKSAAQTQANAQMAGINAQREMFAQTQANLMPFISGGQEAFGNLQAALPGLTTRFQPTMGQLAATPGYQFTLNQGLESTQNAYAAQGLGSSGAAMKGAANYAEGLAGTTFQNQFQNYLAQNSQIYNMLYGPAALGEGAGAALGGVSQNVASSIQSGLVGVGNASAAGTLGAANAYSGALGNLGQYALLAQMSNPYGSSRGFGNFFGGGGGPSTTG